MRTTLGTRAWRVVLDKIERDLVCGALAPGDRLPSERELAVHLGLGRSSVREALRVLEVLGLIRTGAGSGPTAGATVVAAPADGMAMLLRLHVATQRFPVQDLVHTRVMLEVGVVSTLAADSVDPGDVARALLDQMDVGGLTTAQFLKLDSQFHVALAEAAGNPVVTTMMSGLRAAIESYVFDVASRVSDWDAAAERLRREHRAIVAAIDRGDGACARECVTAHIIGYYAGSAGTTVEGAV